MIIQHNISALNSYRQLSGNNSALAKNLEKLSSGYKVNRAGDDAAGLAISEKMRAQIKGLETASKNANDGISVIQTAEGALTEVHSMLNRMVELATQAANGIYGDEERANIQDEINSLNDEIDRIANFTNFNGTLLLTTKADGPGISDGLKLAETSSTAAAAGTMEISLGGLGIKLTGLDAAVKEVEYVVDSTAAATAAAGDDADISAAFDTTTGKLTITYIKEDAVNSGEPFDDSDDFIAALETALATVSSDIGTDVKISGTVDLTKQATAISSAMTKETPEAREMVLQVGDTAGQTIKVEIRDMGSESLGTDTIDVSSVSTANASIKKINDAISTVSSQRAAFGALQNRLDHTITNLGVTTENITAAESRIRDTDMAQEMMNYTKNNILVQAAQSMLAQANMVPQGVLQLLQ